VFDAASARVDWSPTGRSHSRGGMSDVAEGEPGADEYAATAGSRTQVGTGWLARPCDQRESEAGVKRRTRCAGVEGGAAC